MIFIQYLKRNLKNINLINNTKNVNTEKDKTGNEEIENFSSFLKLNFDPF